MTSATEFRTSIDAFLSDLGMTPTMFGRRAVNDPGFVFGIRQGRSPSLETVDKVRKFMSEERAALGRLDPDSGERTA